MSEVGGMSNEVPPTSAGEPTELQLTADRVARGLNLLRWALIAMFASGLISTAGGVLLGPIVSATVTGFVWSTLAIRAIGWLVAPLALVGVLRILRLRVWPVARWVGTSLVIFFAAKCVWNPLTSLLYVTQWLPVDEGMLSVLDACSVIVTLLIALLYFGVLFGGFRLAGAVDAHFGGSLISPRHRRWLLWAGVTIHGLMLAWWAINRIWDLLILLGHADYDDYTRGVIFGVTSMFLVSLPFAAWLIWLLVVALRIGRKLNRSAKRNRCPRCDYYLHDRADAGCPECGWMRASEPAAGGEAV